MILMMVNIDGDVVVVAITPIVAGVVCQLHLLAIVRCRMNESSSGMLFTLAARLVSL